MGGSIPQAGDSALSELEGEVNDIHSLLSSPDCRCHVTVCFRRLLPQFPSMVSGCSLNYDQKEILPSLGCFCQRVFITDTGKETESISR